MSAYKVPKPVFDSLEHLVDLYKQCQSENSSSVIQDWLKACLGNDFNSLPPQIVSEYEQGLRFLYSYRGSLDTFNAYRREIERFLQWAWFVHEKPLSDLKRLDIEEFIEFCRNPPRSWISTKIVNRFLDEDGARVWNQE